MGEGVHRAAPAEGEGSAGFVAAVRADIAGREDLTLAVRADLALQGVALFLISPVSRNFHFSSLLLTNHLVQKFSAFKPFQQRKNVP
jgi:hypothetical protein